MATSNGVVVGKVVQVAGPAVDCEFPEGQIPLIYTAIRITSEGFDTLDPIDIICEVEQHIGEGRVRTIALQPTEGLVRGMKAISLGRPVEVPVGPETLGRSEEHTSELQSLRHLVCRLLLEKNTSTDT